MRTTVTIDDDVATKLQAEMRRQRSSNFKQTLNDVLRRGLLVRRELAASKPFRVRARRMGKMQGLNYDNVGEMLEYLEGAEHK
jgi:Arc/MetJ family transcription regulator